MASGKKKQAGQGRQTDAQNLVQPITPSAGRKRGLKSNESADQEYIQRLADVDCADGMARP